MTPESSVIPIQCKTEILGKKLTLSDPSTSCKLHIKLPEKKTIFKIQIDGCITTIKSTKCDWCLCFSHSTYAFFELKGSDFMHGVTQIENTIKCFQQTIDSFKLHSSHIIISGRSIPNTKTYKQRKKIAFLKKYNCPIKEHKSGSTIAL